MPLCPPALALWSRNRHFNRIRSKIPQAAQGALTLFSNSVCRSDLLVFVNGKSSGICPEHKGVEVKLAMDRRAARTRKALHRALMSLVVRKGYDTVTVQDILDEADVGRATFYAHYTGKEDLLRRSFETLHIELLKAQHNAAVESGAARKEPLSFSLALFEQAHGNRSFYQALAAGGGSAVVTNELRRILSEVIQHDMPGVQDENSTPLDLRNLFIVDAFLTMLNWWLKQKSGKTPAQVNAIFRSLLIDGIGPPDNAHQSSHGRVTDIARWHGNFGPEAARPKPAVMVNERRHGSFSQRSP